MYLQYKSENNFNSIIKIRIIQLLFNIYFDFTVFPLSINIFDEDIFSLTQGILLVTHQYMYYIPYSNGWSMRIENLYWKFVFETALYASTHCSSMLKV